MMTSLVFAMLVKVWAAPEGWRSLHVVRECSVFNLDGELIKEFPGRICLFMDDGRLITTDGQNLDMLDKEQNRLWRLETPQIHHQMNWSHDRQSILVLSSEFATREGREFRDDVVLRVGLDGKILGRISSREIQQTFKENPKPASFNWNPKLVEEHKGSKEKSHFNSVHEIPPSARQKGEMVTGNVIVNDAGGWAYILNSSLTKALRKIPLPNAGATHDVQVTGKGELIYFVNRPAEAPGQQMLYSRVDALNPDTLKAKVLFKAEPRQFFLSPYCGGVQMLDEHTLLVSHMFAGLFVYDLKTQRLIHANAKVGWPAPGWPPPAVQQYRALDLSRFLKAWGS